MATRAVVATVDPLFSPEREDKVDFVVLLHFSDEKGSRSEPLEVILTLLLAQSLVDTLGVKGGRTERATL